MLKKIYLSSVLLLQGHCSTAFKGHRTVKHALKAKDIKQEEEKQLIIKPHSSWAFRIVTAGIKPSELFLLDLLLLSIVTLLLYSYCKYSCLYFTLLFLLPYFPPPCPGR